MSNRYTKALADLNADKSKARWPHFPNHKAPHKPLLLLSIIDLIEQGNIATNLIELNTDLGELFTLYWSCIFPPHLGKRGNIAMPYWHLQSDGFWHLLPKPGKEEVLRHSGKIHSIYKLQDLTIGAKFDQDLFNWLCIVNGRNTVRTILTQTYFSPEMRKALLKQTAVNVQAHQYSLDLLDNKQPPTLKEEQLDYTPVRDQGFRRAITTAYDHRCAFCGVRILTADGHTAIEAAHIIPWSASYDDTIQNGLALCRLCHWGFDEGLLAVGRRLTLLTSKQLSTIGNKPGHLETLDGRTLLPPTHDHYHPAPNNLAWHRQHVYRH